MPRGSSFYQLFPQKTFSKHLQGLVYHSSLGEYLTVCGRYWQREGGLTLWVVEALYMMWGCQPPLPPLDQAQASLPCGVVDGVGGVWRPRMNWGTGWVCDGVWADRHTYKVVGNFVNNSYSTLGQCDYGIMSGSVE